MISSQFLFMPRAPPLIPDIWTRVFTPSCQMRAPKQFLIFGKSGGTSCSYDLAERYRLRNLVAEREKEWELLGIIGN